jgi:plasmid replication initiation protein
MDETLQMGKYFKQVCITKTYYWKFAVYMARLKKKKFLPSRLIVTQSNKLVEARYNLPLGEQRLILTMIANIQPDDEDFKEYRIDVREFADFLGIDRNSAYREFDKITSAIMTRVLIFDESDGPLKVGWVSSAKYISKEGAVLLCFDPKLKPYLLQLKGNFTSCRLEMLLSFKSQYTMRVYNLLKQYEQIRTREFELEELREILGIRKDQYKLYSNFKKDIIEVTQKELAVKADVNFEFSEIKYGRRVIGLRFRIFSKPLTGSMINKKQDTSLAIDATADSHISELMMLIPEQHKKKKTILPAIVAGEKKYGVDYVKRNILYANTKAERSYAVFLNKALKEDWGHDWAIDMAQQQTKKKPKEMWERQGYASKKEYDEIMYKRQMENYSKNAAINSVKCK